MTNIFAIGLAAVVIIGLGLLYKQILALIGVIIIPDDSVGILKKKFVLFGKNKTLPDGAIVALQGEAGVQADTLAPGIHFFLWPWQYTVMVREFITVGEGKIGVVTARDGKALSGGKVLGKKVECDSFQNAREFLANGGERGPQMIIIPPGTYRINTELFSIEEADVKTIEKDKIGIVTTKEGKPLDTGDIAGEEVQGHNMFQDPQAFIDNGGRKGLQTQVLLAGTYFINPNFADVAIADMTEVPIANVGVVIAYVGTAGKDVTGEEFTHGNIVSRGEKGVWNEPLDPGRYPINPFTHKVEIVPTSNVVLNWANDTSEAHRLDENLSTITVRSSDGFTFNLDVAQIIHIPRNDASKMIARFGSIANLVGQVLEPTIGNYFRNAAQLSDAISFLNNRSERQAEARVAIERALKEYDVKAVDTLIGDIVPPAELMKTLTDRKIAEQEKTTFETQKITQDARKELQQATAMADTQPNVVKSEREVQIAEFDAAATVQRAKGEAESKTINAKADAEVTKLTGEADAKKIELIGSSEADVIRKKIESTGQGNYASMQIADSLSKGNVDIVPKVLVNGEGEGGGGITDALIGSMLAGKLATEKEEKSAPKPGEGNKTETKDPEVSNTAPFSEEKVSEEKPISAVVPEEGKDTEKPSFNQPAGKGFGDRKNTRRRVF